MAKFHYKALKNNSVEVHGILEAENIVEARAKLQQLGFLPTNIFEEKIVKPYVEQAATVTSLGLNDKIIFTSELSVMFASGISTVEALETAELHAPNEKVKLVAANLKKRILQGATFTDALRAYEKVFGNLYISLCEAGENSGTLEKSMEYLTAVLKKQKDLRDRVISMSIYPIILIILLITVFILCGKVIFPAFITGAGIDAADVPFMVNLILVPCNILFGNWFAVLITAIAGFFGIRALFMLDSFHKAMDRWFLKLPKVKDFVRYLNLSSYFTVLNVAYEAGVPISKAMTLASNTISNSVIKTEAKTAEKMVTTGKMISQSFSISNLVPPVLNVLVASGEKAGRLGQMFRDASIAIDKQLETAAEVLSRAFEPLVIIIMGCAVAYVVIAYFQLYSGFISSLF